MKDLNLSKRYAELQEDINNIFNSLPNFDVRPELIKEYDDEQSMLFDLPYAETSDKNGLFRIPLAVSGKKDNFLLCIGTGEEYGEEFYLHLSEVNLHAVIDLIELNTELNK